MKPRKRGQLAAANVVDGAVTTRRPGEQVRRCRGGCGALTDGEGYCAGCDAWSPYVNGNSPRRWCVVHGSWSVGLDGWCQPANHVVGPRLERAEKGLYEPEAVPMVEQVANQARVRELLAAIGRPVPKPLTDAEEAARRQTLAAQAQALGGREPGDESETEERRR